MQIKKGANIIELLKDEGLELDIKLENTINMLAYENFEEAKKEGIKEGIKIGIRSACKEFEIKISTMKSKIEE